MRNFWVHYAKAFMLVERLGIEGLGEEDGFPRKSHGRRPWLFELTVIWHILSTITYCLTRKRVNGVGTLLLRQNVIK